MQIPSGTSQQFMLELEFSPNNGGQQKLNVVLGCWEEVS